VSATQRFRVTVDGVEHEVELALEPAESTTTRVVVNGRAYEVVSGPDEVLAVRAESSASQRSVWLEPGAAPTCAHVDGGVFAVEIQTAQQAALSEAMAESGQAAGGGAIVKAPMPGRVVRVLVDIGDDVALEDPVVIVEAMKMENEVRATAPGRIASLAVAAGDTVEPGQPLCEIAPHSDAS
jgi:glutaconyl-CoA/methylmalonyl-CoA decarboxylase subunit gamma